MKKYKRILGVALMLAPITAFAITFDNQKCMRTQEIEFCEKAAELLTPEIPDNLIKTAVLLAAIDSLGWLEDYRSFISIEYDRNKNEMSSGQLDLIAALGAMSENEKRDKALYLSKLLISSPKKIGDDHCIDMMAILGVNTGYTKESAAELLSATKKIRMLLRIDLKNFQPSLNIYEQAAKLIEKQVPEKAKNQELKGNFPLVFFCNPDNFVIKKKEKFIHNNYAPEIKDKCPESAQTYQDRFKRTRRVNDFKCFKSAIEREFSE